MTTRRKFLKQTGALGAMATLSSFGYAGTTAVNQESKEQIQLNFPPLPYLSPTAFTADAGNGKAFLRWNLQFEDERVIGWKVVQIKPSQATITDTLTEPYHVVEGLNNGTEYIFAVVGVLKDGGHTSQSNIASVVPRNVGKATVTPLRRNSTIDVGSFKNITLGQYAVKVVFPDGQELIYDNFRPIDWKTREGEHLLYPEHFGNGVDVGVFEDNGLPKIVPADGPLSKIREMVPPHEPNPDYRPSVQRNMPHACLTSPISLPVAVPQHDAPLVWEEPVVDGDRVTFHYAQPLEVMGFRSWTYLLVWETWWPIERDRNGAVYHGFARHIEVEMPSKLKDGYQIMLNNGFGPGGTRKGVTSYNSGFRSPANEIVDFSPDKNRQVMFQHVKPPRLGGQYHPNQDCLQSHPLIFYDWGHGSLTIAARSLYYHCANNSSSYIEQGADGVWPNLAWDLAIAGKRTSVDTVEYLFVSRPEQLLPQRYLNARFETYYNVSRRMGVQDRLPVMGTDSTLGQVKRSGGPAEFARKKIAELKELNDTGVDGMFVFHDFWHAVPVTVDDNYRLNEHHDINPQLKEMTTLFKAAGMRSGFWLRPEFTKTSIINALSETIPMGKVYYGYRECQYPEVVPLIKARGIPDVRNHTERIRCRKDGSWPYNTPYQWTPMSLMSEWWDKIIWPTLVMSRKLGFEYILMDGGFGGLQGVDYAPRIAKKTDTAVPCQPYWWRLFRSMEAVGLRLFGECTTGWVGGNTNCAAQEDAYFMWMYHLSVLWGSETVDRNPELVHQLYQLYNGVCRRSRSNTEAVRRYARQFYEKHKAPDRVELKNLRQEAPREITFAAGSAPVAGDGVQVNRGKTITKVVAPWVWDDVVWHYNDGTSAVYPAYKNIDWSAV